MKVLTCITQQHDLRLVLVAALVCILGTVAAIRLYRRAACHQGGVRFAWLLLTGFATGTGIWSTHFIAMLAYRPGIPYGYDPLGTVFSLVLAIGSACAGFAIACLLRRRIGLILGGLVIGLGIGVMHYVGMAAFRPQGVVLWAFGAVAISVLIGAALSILALLVAGRHSSLRNDTLGVVILTAAICGLHFTGMSAVTILPDTGVVVPAQVAAPGVLAVMVGVAAAVILLTAVMVAVADVANQRATLKDLKRQAEELARARDRAEDANRAKSAFLANMSHEIRTPLNGVKGVADVLAGMPMGKRQRELVEVIRASAANLDMLLSDILDLARVESGQVTMETRPFCLADLVREITGLFTPQADGKGVRLLTHIDPAAEQMVEGDTTRLKQILTNLVSNAVKFTDAGEIAVSVRPGPDSHFIIEVRDTGVGFDTRLKEQLFQPFQQADVSNTRRHGGAGLGLAICRQCADLLGARLDCESAPGVGTSFTLEVVLPPSVSTAAVAVAPRLETSDETLRALVVDDNATNRTVLELMLSQLGAECVLAEDGLQGVEAYREGRFDVVLMDLQMPVMDGYDATRAIRLHEVHAGLPRTPVIIVSANCMPEQVEAGRAAGADRHLAKPISAAVLVGALAEVEAERLAA